MSTPAPPMFSPAAAAMAERLGLTMGRTNLEVFADTLLELARNDRHILVVTSDSRGSAKLGTFAQTLPNQLVEVGIAEQNLVGITAGLAAAGKIAFGVSPACFLTSRALEQIKNDVCYSGVQATLVGISAGVSYGALGSTHHSLHDLAALRAIHNITIIAPADNLEAREAVRAAAQAEHPVYLRFGKAPMFNLHSLGAKFTAGESMMLREGNDVGFIAAGETVAHALLAAGRLAELGLNSRVLSMHTIKPLDTDAVLRAGRECRAIVTVEEHSVHGGLGEACTAVLMQAGVAVPLRIVGLPDEDTATGSQSDIFRHYGISMEALAKTALAALHGSLVEFHREHLASPVADQLITALNAELTARYPDAGTANHFRLDAEELSDGRGALFVGCIAGAAIGCGAVRRIDPDIAEVKRMYITPAARGCGLGRQMLDELEREARRLGARRLVLETGPRQPEALALYRQAGFAEIPLFGEYLDSDHPELSLCMAKDL
jgi:transketolase